MIDKDTDKKSQTKKLIEQFVIYSQGKDVDISTKLKLFSAFISSNPNFKYNQTYLTDSIVKYVESVSELDSKLSFFSKTATRLFSMYEGNLSFNIYFDEVFYFSNVNSKFELNIKDEIKNYRFDSIGKKEFILTFTFNLKRFNKIILDNNIEYSYLLKYSEELDNYKIEREIDSYFNSFIKTISKYEE